MAPTAKTKKSSERIKLWTNTRKDATGNPLGLHDVPSTKFDSILLLAMIFGVIGVMCHMKTLTWLSMFLTLHSVGQYRGSEDFRQIATSFVISVCSLGMLYMKDPSPMDPQ